MYKHTLRFYTLVDKSVAMDAIPEILEVKGDIDECLTEKQITFQTDVSLTNHQTTRLLAETFCSHYEEEEL